MAAIAAAADAAWPRPAAPPDTESAASVWRFSGRWWHKPATMRRDRPWTRP